MKTNILSLTILCLLTGFCTSSCAQIAATDSVDFIQRGKLLENYMDIKNALANEDLAALRKGAEGFQAEVKKLRLKGLIIEDMMHLKRVRDSIRINTGQLLTTETVEAAKKPASDIATQLWTIVEKMRFDKEKLFLQYCPMEKAYWISREQKIFNPFAPLTMPSCGSVVKGLTDEQYTVADCCH